MTRRHTRKAAAAADPLGRLSAGVRDLRVEGQISARRLMVLGGVLVPLGLLVVLLGWYGASRTSNVYEQIPYLISGGLLGLALVVVGSFLYFAHWLTRLVQDQRRGSASVVDAINRLAEAVDGQAVVGTTNGHAPTVHPVAVVAPDLVATGSGSLAHRPTCRVVVGKPGLRPVDMDDGLEPCRLCDPYG